MSEQGSLSGSPKEQLRAVNILFNALVIGVVLFVGLTLIVIKWTGQFSEFDEGVDKILLVVMSLVSLTCLISAVSGYRKRIAGIDNLVVDFNAKFNNYRSALIFYLALCEGAALFSVMGFLLTANYWCLVITFIMMAAMLFKRPTKQRVINDLQLNTQEQQEL
jgi:hypothetical protein